jgi:predicted nucleic acid-binding protein
MNAAGASTTWRVFLRHRRSGYNVLGISASILNQAERLVFAHPLRAFDAVHIASALAAAGDDPMVQIEFWTADRQQAAAAMAQPLQVRLLQ